MAESPMGYSGEGHPEPKIVSGLVNWAGAIVSIGLVAGGCFWGYQILKRDVSGVPVVLSLEGPMRVQPDDPGGSQARHQGLSVNTVAAVGSAGKPADQLIVAPPPIALRSEDAVVTQIALQSNQAVVTAENLTEIPDNQVEAIVAPPPLAEGSPLSVEELAAQLAAGAQPLSENTVAEEETQVAALAVDAAVSDVIANEATVVPAVTGGIKRSLRPVVRPVGLAENVTLASVDPTATIAVAPKAVEDGEIPSGTRMVQLGAYASPEIAAAEWDKLLARFDTYLDQKIRVIQKASSGGRVFYRLRAMGFSDVSDARRLCSALKAENADCIPVTTR